MTRNDAIYISTQNRRCLVLMAQKRKMDGQNADAIADEIISAFFRGSEEGKSVLAFVEQQEKDRKMFVDGNAPHQPPPTKEREPR